jgi:molecular chaperone IbpA
MASVLYTRSFDPFREIDRLAGSLLRGFDAPVVAPGVDLVKTGEHSFEIVLAVPGYSQDELQITVENGVVTIRGEAKATEAEGQTWLHRGISRGKFERQFTLADYVEVRDAQLRDGLLRVELVREVPEVLKPRTIAINQAQAAALPSAA